MSIRILANAEDTQAVFYFSGSDWAFGPVIEPMSENVSATALAKKFIEWARLDSRGPFEDWSENAIARLWSDFWPNHWRHCGQCHDTLIHSNEVRCAKCETTCPECGEPDVEIVVKSIPGRGGRRMCTECSQIVEACKS